MKRMYEVQGEWNSFDAIWLRARDIRFYRILGRLRRRLSVAGLAQ